MKKYYKELWYHNIPNKIISLKSDHRIKKQHLLDIIKADYNIFFNKKLFNIKSEKEINKIIFDNLTILKNKQLYDEEIKELTNFIINNIKKSLKNKEIWNLITFKYKTNITKTDMTILLSYTIIPSTSYNYDDIFIAKNYLLEEDKKENTISVENLIKNSNKKGIKITYYIRWNLIEIVETAKDKKNKKDFKTYYIWCDTIIDDMFSLVL